MEMLDFLIRLARGAGEKLSGDATIIQQKEGGGNVVTAADMASEEYILEALAENFPNYLCLSEETRSSLTHPEKIPNLFIIDPLDGTTNFARGLPCYCVSIAYAEHGIVQAGVVFDPTRNEIFTAAKGHGALLNGRPIRVAPESSLSGAMIDLGCPYRHEDFRRVLPAHEKVQKQGMRIVNLGSAALECAYVACGRLSAFYESGIKPWDVAAGQILVLEAGGEIHFTPTSGSIFSFRDFLACTPGISEELRNTIGTNGEEY